MSRRAKLLAVLSLPAGAIGYAIAGAVLTSLGLAAGAGSLLLILIPLFVAGLCMIPFVAPLFDEMAKRDLAAAPRRDEPEDPSDTRG